MSIEEPKVSRAFLRSVLSAESAEAEEPDEIVDAASDQQLASQLADKYAVSPKAQRWFGRPWLVVGAVSAAVAAAAILLLRPISSGNPALTAFSVQARPTDRVLQAEPAQSVLRLHDSPTWELLLTAQIAVVGELNVRAFVRQTDAITPLVLPTEHVGHNFKVRVNAASFAELRSPTDLYLTICRTASLPSDQELLRVLGRSEVIPSEIGQSVRLPIGDCQLVSIRVLP